MAARVRLCHILDLDAAGLGALDAAAVATAVRWAEAAAAAGVDSLQLRGRGVDAGRLVGMARAMRAAIAGARTALIVNDRADVALASGADGLHVPAAGLAVDDARRICPGRVIGASAHDAAELARAAAADYVIVGTIFPTPSKPGHPGRGVGALAEAVAAGQRPVLAIGGVSLARVAACRGAGAAGVAGIRLFGDTPATMARAVADLRAAWDDAQPPRV
jgi:thiamine-phosphate pyrophosphorylase